MAVAFKNLSVGKWLNKTSFIPTVTYNKDTQFQNSERTSSESSGASVFNSHSYIKSLPNNKQGKLGFGTYESGILNDFYNYAYFPFYISDINPGMKFSNFTFENKSNFNRNFIGNGIKFSKTRGLFYKIGNSIYGISVSLKTSRPAISKNGSKLSPFCWNRSFYESGNYTVYIYNDRIVKNGNTFNFPSVREYVYAMLQANGGNGSKGFDAGFLTDSNGVEGGSGAFSILRCHITGSNYIKIENTFSDCKVYYNDVLCITLGAGGNASRRNWGAEGKYTINNSNPNLEILNIDNGFGAGRSGSSQTSYILPTQSSDDGSIYFEAYNHANCSPSRLADGGHRGSRSRGKNGSYGSGGGGGGHGTIYTYYDGGTGGSAYINIGF